MGQWANNKFQRYIKSSTPVARIALFNPIETYSTISEFANIVYPGSNIIAEESLKALEWANNKFQRYIKLSTPKDEKLHQDSTV